MRNFLLLASSITVFVLLDQGCSGTNTPLNIGGDAGSDGASSGGSSGGSSSSGGSGSSSSGGGDAGADASDASMCPPPSPGNYDIPNNGCDDDGDGLVDDTPVCDKGLAVDGPAGDFAKALGLCQTATGANDPKWGVVSATYTQGFAAAAPNASQHGLLTKFGSVVAPREGSTFGVLSSGFAREWDDAAGTSANDCTTPTTQTMASCFKGFQPPMTGVTTGGAPPGYPRAPAGCPVAMTTYDTIGVTLAIKVPNNAQGFLFDYDFWSGEWPEWVCSNFNDSFVAWLESAAFTGTAGDLNLTVDAMNVPVSVNNSFFDRCTTNTPTGCSASMTGTSTCAGGTGELAATGFDDPGTYCTTPSSGGGATGWLETKAPAKPGEIMKIQFIIWDTSDPNWDSSVLVDHFAWQPGKTKNGTKRP
jgi:hypothetical protein